MKFLPTASITNWIADASMNGISHFFVADRRLVGTKEACFARHNRLGAIPRDINREGAGVKVHAFGTDELGNVSALCADGFTRQFIR